jgi:hypothetical protein
MKPKEKAIDLCVKMGYIEGALMAVNYIAKRHGLIAVDEILKSNPTLISCDGAELNYAYWIDVKKEIDEL